MSIRDKAKGKKKPWCERAKSRQPVATITEKHAWKHAPRMYLGGCLELMSFVSALSIVAVSIFMSFRLWVDGRDDPVAPSIWEVVLTVAGIGVGVCGATFIVGLGLSLSGKRRMKRLLLPVRCQRCPKCMYDLSNRPLTDDTCPECGVIAPRRECVRLWCKMLRSRF